MVGTRIRHFSVHLRLHVVGVHQAQQLYSFLGFVLAEEHVVNAVLHVTFFLAVFESCEVWVCSGLHELIQIYKLGFHYFRNWSILRLFVEVATKNYWDVLEILRKKLNKLLSLNFPVFDECFFGFQMSLAKYKL